MLEEIEEEREFTRAEKILAAATVVFLLLATIEGLHIAEEELLTGVGWEERAFWSRVLYYGTSLPLALISIIMAPRLRGIGRIYGNVMLGYGLLLLIISVSRFILDCLPEVAAALAGAAGCSAGLWYARKKYYTPERVARSRLSKGLCPFCGKGRINGAFFCPECGSRVAYTCEECGARISVLDKFCPGCGAPARGSKAS